MQNILRALLYNKEVSLTLADTTEIVKRGAFLHKLSPASTSLFGRGMSALTFMSGCLKEEAGEVSIALQTEGECGDIGASGNRALALRGYIGNTAIIGEPNGETERRALGNGGAFTVIRDDGYNRPFVGSCGYPEKVDFDSLVEEYYRISEQLPTRIKTVVEVDEQGACVFAGVIALQPLPFASEASLSKVNTLDLKEILYALKGRGVEDCARRYFGEIEEIQLRRAEYRCNCSRDYLAGVLVTLGEAQMRDIIRTEGAVRVHCHYCNTDYEFTSEDADKLFAK